MDSFEPSKATKRKHPSAESAATLNQGGAQGKRNKGDIPDEHAKELKAAMGNVVAQLKQVVDDQNAITAVLKSVCDHVNVEAPNFMKVGQVDGSDVTKELGAKWAKSQTPIAEKDVDGSNESKIGYANTSNTKSGEAESADLSGDMSDIRTDIDELKSVRTKISESQKKLYHAPQTPTNFLRDGNLSSTNVEGFYDGCAHYKVPDGSLALRDAMIVCVTGSLHDLVCKLQEAEEDERKSMVKILTEHIPANNVEELQAYCKPVTVATYHRVLRLLNRILLEPNKFSLNVLSVLWNVQKMLKRICDDSNSTCERSIPCTMIRAIIEAAKPA